MTEVKGNAGNHGDEPQDRGNGGEQYRSEPGRKGASALFSGRI